MRLFLDTTRDGYDPEQIYRTMTVGELIRFLKRYDEDIPIYTTFDRRYTYGGITDDMFDEDYSDEKESEEEEE